MPPAPPPPSLDNFARVIASIPATSPSDDCWESSAQHLRELIRSRALLYTDLRDDPDKFFEAHKMLADRMLGAFGVRFTVQFNLFAGSILALGGASHVQRLINMQTEGELGCFALTEVTAGVSSGLVVETTATWDVRRRCFTLHTPNSGACKNWISQGLAADAAVVIASLLVDGKNMGPHAFYVKMRGQCASIILGSRALVDGVTVADMGEKTTANELDNARISFNNLTIPQDALLDRYAGFDVYGQYCTRGIKKMTIDVIGQRLLTGRLVIAAVQIRYIQRVLELCQSYAEARLLPPPPSAKADCRATLASLPHIRSIFRRCEKDLDEQDKFCSSVQSALKPFLLQDALVPASLAEAISVAKIRGVHVALRCCRLLQEELGSQALMAGDGHCGFVHADILLCAKFAEGDSRMLMQKLARDHLKQFQARGAVAVLDRFSLDPHNRAEAALCMKIGGKLRAAAAAGAQAVYNAWNESWEDIYALANAVCDRHFANPPATLQVTQLSKL
jgi:acyl-CoA oxidase